MGQNTDVGVKSSAHKKRWAFLLAILSPVCKIVGMPLTLEDLDRRATTLEGAQSSTVETLRWVVPKLARVQAVQDEHTLRLERLETKVDGLETKVGRLETKLDGLIEALPGIVADAVRAARA